MAIRNVVQTGDEILRKKSFEVVNFDHKLHELLEDMKDTLVFERGAGLAAVQVGVLRRVAIVSVEEGYFEFINPEIISEKGEQSDYEGCLSVRGKRGIVKRPLEIKVKAKDRYGKNFTLEAQGFFARAICHEIDHLNGILYTDLAKCIEIDN